MNRSSQVISRLTNILSGWTPKGQFEEEKEEKDWKRMLEKAKHQVAAKSELFPGRWLQCAYSDELSWVVSRKRHLLNYLETNQSTIINKDIKCLYNERKSRGWFEFVCWKEGKGRCQLSRRPSQGKSVEIKASSRAMGFSVAQYTPRSKLVNPSCVTKQQHQFLKSCSSVKATA